MRYLKLFLLCIFLFVMTSCIASPEKSTSANSGNGKQVVETGLNINEEDIENVFKKGEGCFVIKKVGEDKYITNDEEFSEEQITPNSTFKIPNTLIGLEEGVVKGKDTLFRWDGENRTLDVWNKDHTLESAVKNSVVWYFQKLARDVGKDKMQKHLDEMNYGNKDISGGIDEFWLASSLKISLNDQVDFLEKLYKEELPFSKKNIKTTKEIIYLEEGENGKLYGKTGTTKGGVEGLFVGYIESKNGTYIFASYMKGKTGAEVKEAAKQVLM